MHYEIKNTTQRRKIKTNKDEITKTYEWKRKICENHL